MLKLVGESGNIDMPTIARAGVAFRTGFLAATERCVCPPARYGRIVLVTCALAKSAATCLSFRCNPRVAARSPFQHDGSASLRRPGESRFGGQRRFVAVCHHLG